MLSHCVFVYANTIQFPLKQLGNMLITQLWLNNNVISAHYYLIYPDSHTKIN